MVQGCQQAMKWDIVLDWPLRRQYHCQPQVMGTCPKPRVPYWERHQIRDRSIRQSMRLLTKTKWGNTLQYRDMSPQKITIPAHYARYKTTVRSSTKGKHTYLMTWQQSRTCILYYAKGRIRSVGDIGCPDDDWHAAIIAMGITQTLCEQLS